MSNCSLSVVRIRPQVWGVGYTLNMPGRYPGILTHCSHKEEMLAKIFLIVTSQPPFVSSIKIWKITKIREEINKMETKSIQNISVIQI